MAVSIIKKMGSALSSSGVGQAALAATGTTPDGGIVAVVGANGKGASLFAKSLRGAAKWFGAAQTTTFNEPTGNLFTMANYGAGQKITAEAPFVAVRLFWVHRGATAMTGSKALVAVTETADTSVAASAFHPVIGGVTYNSLVAFPNVLGWRAVTWAGVATVDHPAANLAAQVKASDWINLASVPRADIPGALPLLLIRGEHDGSAQGGFATLFNGSLAVLRTAIAAARGRIVQTFTGTGMVTNVASVNGAIGTATFEIFPEFRYSVPSLSVCGVGDSITQCESLGITGTFTSWGMRGCADASTQARPVNWASCGAAQKTFAEYWARFLELFAAGYSPDVLVNQPLSYNDYSTDVAHFDGFIEQGKSRAQLVHEFARNSNCIRSVIFVGLFPWSLITSLDAARLFAYNQWLKTFAESTGNKYLDFSVFFDSAAKWQPQYNRRSNGSTCTISIASPAVVSLVAHGRSVGDSVEMNSTGLLPAEIPNGTRVFVASVPDANSLTLSLTSGGPAINTTGTQSGTHTLNFTPDNIHENEFAMETVMAPALTAVLNTIA